jgi:hypothetical protein
LIAPQLDGPRHETMWGGHGKRPTLRAGFNGSGVYTFMGYDAARERYHQVTTGAAGYLDGAFSRARLYLSDYHGGHERAYSPDGRFFYYLADFYGQKIRALDFAEQRVSTLAAKGAAVTCGESGKVYLVQNEPLSLSVLSPGPEWKVLETKQLQGEQRLEALGTALAVDEKHDRLYVTTFGPKEWYVWYWDTKDGSFHGVLPICRDKSKMRTKDEAGPFEGTLVYNHGEICWGPDDPDKRFLYMTRVDTWALFRLDLERRMLAVFKGSEGRFVDQGKADTYTCYSESPFWFEDGSFLGQIPWYYEGARYLHYKRVK